MSDRLTAPIDAPEPERRAWDAGYVAGIQYQRHRAEQEIIAAQDQAGDMQLLANEQEQRAIKAESALAAIRTLLQEEIKGEGGPTVNYCWWCQRNINGIDAPVEPHNAGCWLVRVQTALAAGGDPPTAQSASERTER